MRMKKGVMTELVGCGCAVLAGIRVRGATALLAELPPRLQRPPRQLARKMDQETLGSVVLLAIVTLISVVQNGIVLRIIISIALLCMLLICMSANERDATLGLPGTT
ncbi:hypothetical protein Anapl_14973 [Anas platyrhynchos]|uniref:Uncharacterized protein n=1 Tax=Anas platyrhynchos TaxID=8839 RepID=R0JXJ2_ANAPL|nr:hypothetical protein Anapl_14973 [Anas platyrhynchos]